MTYIITFFTHYEALCCKRVFENIQAGNELISTKLIPVPRELSSSCGTALKVEMQKCVDISFFDCAEHDSVFLESSEGEYISIK